MRKNDPKKVIKTKDFGDFVRRKNGKHILIIGSGKNREIIKATKL